MLKSRFKNLHLVSSFIEFEIDWLLMKNMIKKSLYHMFLKCHHHLHLLVDFESGLANKEIDEDYNLNFFEMIVRTSELTKENVDK
jgi:hypothetical protein